jgi:hypothetical protein
LPNWLYLVFQFVYDLGLALWIGGTIVLGAAAAPVLFKSLPRPQAGAIFGPILAKYARIQAIALLMIVLGAAARFLIWERHAATLWLIGRWAAICDAGVGSARADVDSEEDARHRIEPRAGGSRQPDTSSFSAPARSRRGADESVADRRVRRAFLQLIESPANTNGK